MTIAMQTLSLLVMYLLALAIVLLTANNDWVYEASEAREAGRWRRNFAQ